MSITNQDRPITTLDNGAARPVNYETWDSNDSSWDTELRTWDEMNAVITNALRQSATINSNTVFQSVAIRNNYSGTVGFRFSVSEDIYVYEIGRLFVAQNTRDHVMNIWVSTDTVTPVATATVLVGANSDINGYKYATLPSPVLLSAGNTYSITVDVVSGEDMFKDQWSMSGTLQSIFTPIISCFQGSPSVYPVQTSFAGNCFDCPTMKYRLSSGLGNITNISKPA